MRRSVDQFEDFFKIIIENLLVYIYYFTIFGGHLYFNHFKVNNNMGIESSLPQIKALRLEVEQKFGKKCEVPADFVALADQIELDLKQHISPTTLERVWNYSTRGETSISLHTINILCKYINKTDWTTFCKSLNESGIIDSDMIEGENIEVSSLSAGDRLLIGWVPDRMCVIEYLGDYKFMAIRCENSTMQPGDTFKCVEFIKNQPAIMDEFFRDGEIGSNPKRYIAGKHHGLSFIKKI